MGRTSDATRKKLAFLQKANQIRKERALERKNPAAEVQRSPSGSTSISVGTQTEQAELSGVETQPDNAGFEVAPSRNVKKTDPKTKTVASQVKSVTKRNIPHAKITKTHEGRRIVSLASLDQAVQNISLHSSMCGKGQVEFKLERKSGMNTQLYFVCKCGRQFIVSGNGSNDTLDLNNALVWGSTVSATGYKATAQFLTAMDIPVASFGLYNKTQAIAHPDFMTAMKANMKKWALEEARLALENNETVMVNYKGTIHEYPAITVIVDGGWTKRSYKHSFSSNCGVAVIIGARTQKVIYMDTRISTCAVCDRKRDSSTIPTHECYKNWSMAPNGMESDIIVNGFKSSIEMYGLVYSKFVGDGDSSVHFNVENVYSGVKVEKIECSNHIVKNFTTRLMDISKDKVNGMKISLEQRKLFNPQLPRFRKALTQAIAYHHKQGSHWKELYDDIMNIPYHIFGHHQNCKQYFCKGSKPKELDIVGSISKTELWKAIDKALERPATLAPSLVKKESSNYAECFMSVACRFIEGKRKNFGQRFLYRIRMAGAVFSYNECGYWATEAYKLLQKNEPSEIWKNMSTASLKERKRPRKYQLKRPLKIQKLCAARFEYGENPQKPDLPDSVLSERIKEKKASLQVTPISAHEIEVKTRDQALSEEWMPERYPRLTASVAADVFNLGDKTDNTCVLNKIFGKKTYAGKIKALEYGKDHEDTAIREYERVNGIPPNTVQKVGLVVSLKNGIFGASPDGYVGADGMVEVKCPYSLFLQDKLGLGPAAWPEISKGSSLSHVNGKLELKKKHAHYYQVVMQIYVTGRQWCDYFVWSEHGHFMERVFRTPETDILWSKMERKLEKFWDENVAPELVDSRFERGYSEYRCPQSRENARKKKNASKKM